MDTRPPPRLQKRNVEVVDSAGAVIAGTWQYGALDWEEFYRCLVAFVITREEWAVFEFDPAQQQRGAICLQGPQIVPPGQYILLSITGAPIAVGVVQGVARPRNPTVSNTHPPENHYRIRGRARDRKCLITGLETDTYQRLKVAHIFPRAHSTEWVRKGYPSKISDTEDVAAMGGPTKIDSIQNVITLRSDLHDSWDNYEYGVNPDKNYRITAFRNGLADIDGLHLQLDHIDDQNLRPLDVLFVDHFMQGIFKHMRGAAESGWTDEDFDDVFGSGSFDVSNPKVWGTSEGKERFELALADLLFDHRVLQQSQLTAE